MGTSDAKMVINLTVGMGCSLVLGGVGCPLPPAPGTEKASALERLVHIEDLRLEICTLDCGTLNYDMGPRSAPRGLPPSFLQAEIEHAKRLHVAH
ncbi:hypothetical protein [Bradyrhizobium sp. USDA 4504]